MRNTEEITAEIKKLSTMKPTVRRFSGFGDDHHAAIEAQIEVLQSELSEDDIFANWDEQNVRDGAVEALFWMKGEEDTAPSTNWEDLVQ